MSRRTGRSHSPFNVDLERLLAPISIDQPSGESLRYQGAYDAVEELRRQDDPDLPQGVWQRELKTAEWDQVTVLCQEALETKTKDLKIAAWLLESWLYLHGYVGIECGLRLIQGLCEGFWDSVHPQIDDGDLDYRLAPLLWIDDRISQTLQILPVTDPETDESPAYAWIDWQSGLRLANLARINSEAAEEEIAKGKVTQEKLLVSVSLTPTPFYRRKASEIEATRAALGRLAATLREQCGPDAPTFSRLDEILDTIHRFVSSIVEQRRLAGDVNGNGNGNGENGFEEPAFDEEAPDTRETPAAPTSGRRLRSRAEAYRQLAEAADYLLRTEPHSPTPYLVKRAVAWGNLTLSELLGELVNDQSDLKTIYTLLGMKDLDR